MARAPGPQNTGAYPFVGDNYAQWGEQTQNGLIYHPWSDTYYYDPEAIESYNVQAGLKEAEPEPESLYESLLPVAGAGAAIYGGKALGEGLISGEGLFGLGSTTAPTTATTGATTGAAAAAPEVLGAGFTASGPAAGTATGSAATGTGLMGTGLGIAPLAAIAGATALGGKAAYDIAKGEDPNPIGRVTLGMATGGLSELAKASGVFDHKSTRDVAKEHTADLLSQGTDDANWQNYVSGMREQHNHAAPDPSKPFAGKYGSWDEYKNSGLEANDLTGVYGNLDTFGPEWANYSEDDRVKITQGLIDNDLYNSKKGEVEITDAERARQVRDQLMNSAIPTEAQGGLLGVTSPQQGTALTKDQLTPEQMELLKQNGLMGLTGI